MKWLSIFFLLLLLPTSVFALPAVDVSATGASGSASITPTQTGGLDFVVAGGTSASGSCSGATIGGTTMTLIKTIPGVASTYGAVYLYNVATSVSVDANISAVVTCTVASTVNVVDVTGVNQSVPVDASNQVSTTQASPLDAAVTTIAANDMLIATTNEAAFNPTSGGTNTTALQLPSSGVMLFSSTAVVAAGANQLVINWTGGSGGSQQIGYAILALQPVGAAPTVTAKLPIVSAYWW